MRDPQHGYNTPIPVSITTPDRVPTRIGEFEFFDGLPTPDSARLAIDHLDFLRGIEVFLNGVPPASLGGCLMAWQLGARASSA